MCCMVASILFGQRVYFGVVGGTNIIANFPTTDYSGPGDSFGNPAYRFQYFTGPRSLILGALVEGRLSESFSIEAEALRRPMPATIVFTQFPSGAPSVVSTDHFIAVDAWEFPVMLKYTLPALRFAGGVRPFLEAGPSFRSQENAAATQPSQFGISAGAGVAWQMGRFRIAPMLRYTRWDPESIYPKYATKPDQIELLTSFAYVTDAESRRLWGHRVELGAMAGYPLTRGFGPDFGQTVPERTRYLVGVTAQVNVSGNFSIETDAVYKPLRAGNSTLTQFSVITWEFPVLAKYSWTRFKLAPFTQAGPSFRAAGNLNGYNPSHYGFTAGGGVETRWHGFRLSPGLRYTRWATDASVYRLPPGVFYAQTNPNAVEFVFAVSF